MMARFLACAALASAGLWGTLFGAPAAANPLCADPAASCRALISTDCLPRLAAGSEALALPQGAEGCEGERKAYIACVTKATTECASDGGGPRFAPEVQAKLSADCDRCPSMIALPKGAFTMGSSVANESPPHQVTVSRAIAMSAAEISFDEWDFCASDGGCAPISEDGGWGRGGQPVINVTYEAALGYAAWLSARTGRRYRLPTESEWEYAARANGAPAVEINCRNCAGGRGQPVATGRANGFGLAHMVGNVAEWTLDCRTTDYSRASGQAHQAQGGGRCVERVTRGGSWADRSSKATVSNRSFRKGALGAKTIGFRVVREE